MMDPALFRIDWEVITEVLAMVIVLSFMIERALAMLFEHRLFVAKFHKSGLKEPISLLLSLAVVYYWKFDVLSIMFHADKTSLWGYFISAAIIAGGSKASIKLFHDILNVKSRAYATAAAVAKQEMKPDE